MNHLTSVKITNDTYFLVIFTANLFWSKNQIFESRLLFREAKKKTFKARSIHQVAGVRGFQVLLLQAAFRFLCLQHFSRKPTSTGSGLV